MSTLLNAWLRLLLPIYAWAVVRSVRYVFAIHNLLGRLMSPAVRLAPSHGESARTRLSLGSLVVVGLAHWYWLGLTAPILDGDALLVGLGSNIIITLLVTAAGVLIAGFLSPAGHVATIKRNRPALVAIAVFFGVWLSLPILVLIPVPRVDGYLGVATALGFIALSLTMIVLLGSTLVHVWKHKFRVAESSPLLLPLVVAGSALVALARSVFSVSNSGLADDYPAWMGALCAFVGPLGALALAYYYDARALMAKGEVRWFSARA